MLYWVPMRPTVSVTTYCIRLLVVAAAYALVAHLSLFLVPAGGSGASLVWPPAAVALAALYFWGYEMWPALVLSFFALLLSRGIAPPLAVGVAVGNTLEALAAAYLLRLVNFLPLFSRLRDSGGFIVAVIIGSLCSATFITASVYLFNGSAGPFNTALWAGLWVGHTVSLLSFGAFALRWLARPLFTKTRRELLEGLLLFTSLTLINFFLYWTSHGSIGGISLIYISVLFYIWASLRTGPRGTTLALAMSALIAATGVFFGSGPIAAASNLSQALFGIQILIGTLSVIFLLFASTTEERKEAVIDLEKHVDQLESALERIQSEDQAKSDFIAILAHELRNPLSPILSGLEILKSRPTTHSDVVRMMGAHVHTLARLLDDLLDITRISQKKFKLERTPVELGTVIDHTLEMVDPAMREREHTFKLSLAEGEVWLNADPVRLAQVFANILGNAAKYTDPGGTIRLSTKRQRSVAGEQIVVTVQDNGTGISPERLPHVFDAFGGREGGGRKSAGLRIGLSLAKRMVELHHGTIEARSGGEGRGSEFIVTLPLSPVQMPLQPQAAAQKRTRFSTETIKELVARKGPTRILVCDDNRGAAQTLAKLLENNGHEVLLAYTGEEALSATKEHLPRIALLDIGLPDMDGYELAVRMREMHPGIRLVALSGYGQEDDKKKSRTAGFSEHLVKPVSIVDIERVLSELGVRQ